MANLKARSRATSVQSSLARRLLRTESMTSNPIGGVLSTSVPAFRGGGLAGAHQAEVTATRFLDSARSKLQVERNPRKRRALADGLYVAARNALLGEGSAPPALVGALSQMPEGARRSFVTEAASLIRTVPGYECHADRLGWAPRDPAEIAAGRDFLALFVNGPESSLPEDAKELMRHIVPRSRGPWSVPDFVQKVDLEQRPDRVVLRTRDGTSYYYFEHAKNRQAVLRDHVENNPFYDEAEKEEIARQIRESPRGPWDLRNNVMGIGPGDRAEQVVVSLWGGGAACLYLDRLRTASRLHASPEGHPYGGPVAAVGLGAYLGTVPAVRPVDAALLAAVPLFGASASQPDGSEAKRHLRWCVDRAMEYANRGDYRQAINSFLSDVEKNAQTSACVGGGGRAELSSLILISSMTDPETFRKAMEGFNV